MKWRGACGVTPLQVDEVIGYYSMLHRKPLGKYHVQVCTNISCLLRGRRGTVRARLRKSWASATRKSRRRPDSRSKKWSAWAPVPGRRRSR